MVWKLSSLYVGLASCGNYHPHSDDNSGICGCRGYVGYPMDSCVRDTRIPYESPCQIRGHSDVRILVQCQMILFQQQIVLQISVK